MTLVTGTKLGPYEISKALGAGGMGEVYRAQDTKLGRDVALKVLPQAFARDDERMARFEREAKILASLNHPNIAIIHGLEQSGATCALVMELVEGLTVADRILSGPIPIDEALPIAKQIAEGLEYAHERGIIHRDLKPSNVKVTPDGNVKILDFGLAKALEGDSTGEELQNSPTLTAAATRAGILLGTAAYMSPEQARGKQVDRRADIWAFGCVLYEMLTGRSAFTGETISDTLASVIRAEPDWSSVPGAVPPRTRELLCRCLQKDPKHRLQAIGDARIAVEEVLSGSVAGEAVSSPGITPPRSRLGIAITASATVAALATTLVLWNLRPRFEAKPITRFAITLPAGAQPALATSSTVAISPDGTHLVLVAGSGETSQLYLRTMDHVAVTPLPDTQDARSPFFSPDGQWVGFFANQKLKKVSLHGGTPIVLCDVGGDRGGSWGPDDRIIFAPAPTAGLMQIRASGGTPQPLTTLDASKGERTHRWPEILPGGRAVAFTIGSLDSPNYFLDAKIAVYSLETSKTKILPVTGTFPHYESSGHLVFAQSGGVFAVPFDLKRLEVSGAPVAMLSDVAADPTTGAEHFALSRTGSLAYVPGASALTGYVLAWVDRKGQVQPLPTPAHGYANPRLSPDGRRIAVAIGEPRSQAIWVYDIPHGTLMRLTYGANDSSPVWTPDGKHIAYGSEQRNGTWAINWKPADGSGAEETLIGARPTGQGFGTQFPSSFSADGKYLAYTSYAARISIWILPLEGKREPRPFLQTEFDPHAPRLSPDGHWIAYVSNESGRQEVYVQPFPVSGGKWQVSTEGGVWPVWAHDGHELFYLNGNKVMSVAVATQPTFAASTPRVLADTPIATRTWTAANGDMDVSPDGHRFLIVKAGEEKTAPAEVHVVLNWTEELKRLAPSGK